MGEGGRKEEEKGKGGEGKQRERGIERKKEASPPVHFSISVIAESTYLIMYMHVYYTDFVHLLRHIN